MTRGPRSHELRRAVHDELGIRSRAASTGLAMDTVAAALRRLGEDAPEPHEVYSHDTPCRAELRQRLAEAAGMPGYGPPRDFNNTELEQLLRELEGADR